MALGSCKSLMRQKYFSNELQLQKYLADNVQCTCVQYSECTVTHFPTACELVLARLARPWRLRHTSSLSSKQPATLRENLENLATNSPPPLSLPILSIAIILERDLYAVAQEIYFLGFTRNLLSVRRLDEAICARSDTMAINTVGVQSSYVLHLNSELIESENTEHYGSQACWRPLERLHQFGV